MSLPALFRPPIVWLVAAEAILVLALAVLAWRAWTIRQVPSPVAMAPPAAVSPGAAAGAAPGPTQPPVTAAPGVVPQPGPTPGLRADPDFLSRQFREINRVETTLHEVQWRVMQAVADAVQRYLEGVVLPVVERALRGER